MGLDPDGRENLYRWSDAMMSGDGHTDPDDPVLHAAAEAFGEYVEYLIPIIEARRVEPREDMISILTGAFDEGALDGGDAVAVKGEDALTSDELLMFLCILVVAGNETTRNAITGGLKAFSDFPDQKQKLIDQPRARRSRRRRDRPLRVAGHLVLPHRHPRPRVPRQAAQGGRQGADPLPVGQPRRARVRRSRRLPDRPRSEPASRLRHRPALLPRRQPGQARGEGGVRGAVPRLARHPRAPTASRSTRGDNALVLAIEHLPAVFTPTGSRA